MRKPHPVRAVIGVPLYNSVSRGHLREAVDSLRRQTFRHVAYVFLDDGSTDGTRDEVARIVSADRRVIVESNPHRMGLIDNWRRTFDVARQRFPEAEYFAWGSDHDVWDHRWLDLLVAELDAHPEAALAVPLFTRIDRDGVHFDRAKSIASTAGLPRHERFAAASAKLGAGKMVYGLYRASMLEKAGVYPRVLQPDVYLMMELSLYGEIRAVKRTLWHRREFAKENVEPTPAKPARHQNHLFAGPGPTYLWLPPWVQHAWLLVWRLVACGRGRPDVGRTEAARYAGRFVLDRLTQKDRKQVRHERLARKRARTEEQARTAGDEVGDAKGQSGDTRPA